MGGFFDLDYHKKKFHGSNLKDLTPAEANDDKREEEVGNKASKDEEHTKDGALFEEPMLPTRSNEEILPCSVLSHYMTNTSARCEPSCMYAHVCYKYIGNH